MNPFKSLLNYFRASKIELEKVAWPTQKDIIRYSTMIVAVSVVAALFFSILDSALHTGITTIISRRHAVTAQAPVPTPAEVTASPVDVTTSPVSSTAPVTAPANTAPTTNVITGQPIQPTAPAKP